MNATDELKPIIKIYGNGNFYCKKIYQTMGLEYNLRRVEKCL
jgi:hypothetical protein